MQHRCMHSILLHCACEELPQFIIAHLSYISRRHTENSGTGNGICCGASRHIFYTYLFQGFPNAVSRFHIDVLHTSAREMKLLQKFFIGQHSQYVRQRITYSQY